MQTVIRRQPRWLLGAAVAALLLAGIAFGPGARAQDNSDTTPTPEATTTATADTATAADTSASSDTFAAGDTAVVADGPLNLRSAAGTSADIVTKLDTGASVSITGGPESADGFDWYEVTADGQAGWVAGKYLAADTGAAKFAAGDVVEVADGPLNVRASASTSADVAKKLQTGDTVTIVAGPTTADGHAWYQISIDGTTAGWVAGEFLAAVSSGPDNGGGADFAVGDAVLVAVDHMNFRAAAGTDADILDTLDLNALFVIRDGPVTANGYTWYKVFNYYYGEGWVAGELLKSSSTAFPGA